MTATTVSASPLVLRRPSKGAVLLGILAIWLVAWRLLFGTANLPDGGPTFISDWFLKLRDSADASRLTSPLFVYVFNPISTAMTHVIDVFGTFTVNMGWTGMTALAIAVALVVAGPRYAVLAGIGFLSFGVLGLWTESMQTLSLVVVSVVLSLLIGIPLGIWAGLSNRFNALILPVLDVMQINPSIAYLPLITLFFLIGPAAGAIATMIYAIPPAIRLTAEGVREVSAATVEAGNSLGATRWQLLSDVQLPMAKRTIVVGVNQTMMAALAMATIAALIATPGLGAVVYQGITLLDTGFAFNGGLALVVMAIVFDRVTTAASIRAETANRAGRSTSRSARLVTYGVAAAVMVVGIVLPSILPKTAHWPDSWIYSTQRPINSVANWMQLHWYSATTSIKDKSSAWFIDPLQSLLTNSPTLVTIVMITAIAAVIAGLRASVVTVICLVGCVLMGLWQSSMVTPASVLVGAAITMVIGVAFGVWIGRSLWADRILRPLLDAGQVMPPFVYLLPGLALFGPTRFTGIFAAVIYAAPAVIKIAGEGIRGVSTETMEAGEAAGSNAWQMITKVQLPMARTMLLVALNQGIIFVLAMVAVGGLVGAGGLGLDVVDGFTQSYLAGVALAAGFCIVFLGIMLDRVTQAAGRSERR